jgi:hypothetical protein
VLPDLRISPYAFETSADGITPLMMLCRGWGHRYYKTVDMAGPMGPDTLPCNMRMTHGAGFDPSHEGRSIVADLNGPVAVLDNQHHVLSVGAASSTTSSLPRRSLPGFNLCLSPARRGSGEGGEHKTTVCSRASCREGPGVAGCLCY